MEKSCCFFGHRDTPATVRPGLTEAVTELIEGIRKGRNFGELYEVPSFDEE